MHTLIISKRYIAIMETGADDHLIKMDDNEMAIIPINIRSDRLRSDLLILGKEILLVSE